MAGLNRAVACALLEKGFIIVHVLYTVSSCFLFRSTSSRAKIPQPNAFKIEDILSCVCTLATRTFWGEVLHQDHLETAKTAEIEKSGSKSQDKFGVNMTQGLGMAGFNGAVARAIFLNQLHNTL